MATRDKKVQVILQYLNPFDHFEEVCQSLRGLDFPVEALLEWMHDSDHKDSNNQYYTERARYNEREKITRFESFLTLAEKGEHDHVRGFATLKQLWNKIGQSDEALEDMANDLDDEDVEYKSGLSSGNYGYTPRVKVNKFYSYESIDPAPAVLGHVECNQWEAYSTFLKTLFKEGDSIYFSMDCFGGVATTREKALEIGGGPLFCNINPCTDNGTANVTRFDHYLLEIDEDENKNIVPLDKQLAWILASKLPISTITYSGGKSLHATVKVEAEDLLEYRDRVDEIRDYCVQLGMPLDRKVIDSSRYTRVAGGMRGDKVQYLVSTNVGSRDYSDWLVKRLIYLKETE